MILFIGDKPSSKNTNQNTPFIGTPSFKVFTSWLLKLRIISFHLYNSITSANLERIVDLYDNGAIVIALGNNASKRLNKLEIKHFKLPHPSPKNRLLNNKQFVENILKDCYNYING